MRVALPQLLDSTRGLLIPLQIVARMEFAVGFQGLSRKEAVVVNLEGFNINEHDCGFA